MACSIRGLRGAEDAHEAGGGLLIAALGAPLLEPRPEPLHEVAIGVDPVRAGDRVFVLLGRDRRTRAQGPDVLAKGMTTQASVRHHPFRHPGQAVQGGDPRRQFMRWAGARMKATARPSPSGITQALVPYPPRERP